MKRFLCAGIVLLLLSACSVPEQQHPLVVPDMDDQEYALYEFTFSVSCLQGQGEDWEFVYTCQGKTIQSGYQIPFLTGVFSLYSVRVDVLEKDTRKRVSGAAFPAPIYDGGSGNTHITVTGTNGKSASFQVACSVTRIASP